jgi:hypothetical protein
VTNLIHPWQIDGATRKTAMRLIARWKARALFAPVDPEAIGHFRIIMPFARKCDDDRWVRLPNMSLTLASNYNVNSPIRDDGQMDMHENRKNFLQKMCIDTNFTAASGDAQDRAARKYAAAVAST